MKALRYITYLFYSYYSTGSRKNIAYFSAILAVTFLVYIHILIALALLNADRYFPLSMNESRETRYFKLLLLLCPFFLIFYFGIKEKNMIALKEKMAYQYDREYNHRLLLFVYFFLSFAALIVLAIVRKH